MMKWFVIQIMGVLFSISVFSQETGKDCKGFFRWDVKTLTDDAGKGLLSAIVHDSSLAELVSVHPPKHFNILSKSEGNLPRYHDENQVVRLVAIIVSVNTQRDQDFHILLKSPDFDEMMIGEIPDPTCRIFDSLPELRNAYREARIQLEKAMEQSRIKNKPALAEITGIPFWDARHWWLKGCSRNGREIHPVLSVKILPDQK